MLDMAAVQPGERVLDVACGTGLVSFRVAAAVGAAGRGRRHRHLGRDGRGGAPRRAPARGIGNVRFERSDAEDLPFADATLRCRGLRPRADVRAGPGPGAARDAPAAAAGRPGGRGGVGCAASCGWAEIFPITDARVASEVCPMFFHLGTQDMLARELRRGRLRRRPPRAAADHAALRLGRGRARRGVPRRPGGARLQPLRRGDPAGGPRRVSRIHRRLPRSAMATGCRASSWSPPPGCPFPQLTTGTARRKPMTMTMAEPRPRSTTASTSRRCSAPAKR